MGFMDKAKAALLARKAYQTYTGAVELGSQNRPEEAKAKYQSALSEYAEAMRLGNQSPSVLLSYALLSMREGDFDAARERLIQLSEQPNLSDDDRFQLRINYSIMLWGTGKLDDAIATIKRAADMKMNGSVYSMLGMYLVEKAQQTGDFTEAIEFNRKAMDYDDEDGEVLDNMGQLYESMSAASANDGDAEKAAEYCARARAYYEKAHQKRPRQITTIYYLARMLEADGEHARAVDLLEDVDKLYYSSICPVSKEMMLKLRDEIGA